MLTACIVCGIRPADALSRLVLCSHKVLLNQDMEQLPTYVLQLHCGVAVCKQLELFPHQS